MKQDLNKEIGIEVLHVYSKENQVYLKKNSSAHIEVHKLNQETEWLPIKFRWKSINESQKEFNNNI